MTLLVPVRDLEKANRAERRAEFARGGKADGTWLVYDRAWARFEAWAAARGEPTPLPASPELVADYAIALFEQGLCGSTIRVVMSAIAHRHALRALPTPTAHSAVAEVLAGIYRKAGKEGRGRGASDPLMPDDIRRMIAKLPTGLTGTRDLALLTFGFATGFRRSELVRITVEDLTFEGDAVIVFLSWSKRDQVGEGHRRRIVRGDHAELCPVQNLRLWLAASGIRTGALFRGILRERVQDKALSPRRVDEIVRRAARAIDLGHFSSHSLRSGLCTAAAIAGKQQWEIQEHVAHKSPASTARYIRVAKVHVSTLTKGIGL
jgi:integrase